MNKLLIIGLLFSMSALAHEYEDVDTHNPQMEIIQEEGSNKVTILYPYKDVLEREAAGDVVYFGARKKGKRVCAILGFGAYVRGSKVVIETRAVSTSNVLRNRIGYRMSPISRLADGYNYPKTKIIKEIQCFYKDGN